MLGELNDVKMQLRTLMATDVSNHYPNYKTILSDVKYWVQNYESHIKMELQEILPNIRGGGGESEQALTNITGLYYTSVYYSDNIEKFLKGRKREIGTINIVLNAAKKSKKVTVDFGGSSDGNKCIINNDRSVIFTMRVLPKMSIGQDYIYSTPGEWDESTKVNYRGLSTM